MNTLISFLENGWNNNSVRSLRYFIHIYSQTNTELLLFFFVPWAKPVLSRIMTKTTSVVYCSLWRLYSLVYCRMGCALHCNPAGRTLPGSLTHIWKMRQDTIWEQYVWELFGHRGKKKYCIKVHLNGIKKKEMSTSKQADKQLVYAEAFLKPNSSLIPKLLNSFFTLLRYTKRRLGLTYISAPIGV